MGIFQKKHGDFGSMFGRHKKEKMTSKENEDEKSLVSVSKSNNSKVPRKASRKNKINTKFRRLREDWEEPGTPEYEPPKGLDFPSFEDHDKPQHQPSLEEEPADTSVPDAIDISISANDTISTLEGSLVEIMNKERNKKKNRLYQKHQSEKSSDKNLTESEGWILNFQDMSFGGESYGSQKNNEKKPPKSSKKDRKYVEPKFYPLQESLSTDGSSKFEMPDFNHSFSRQSGPNIQFTCSEEFENDENVEKVSSVGSDDFHQFVVRKMPTPAEMPPPLEKKPSKRDNSMKKAAESIAISLSGSTPQKTRSRMVPLDSSSKRYRKVLADSTELRSATPPRNNISESKRAISSEPRLRPKKSDSKSKQEQAPKVEIDLFHVKMQSKSSVLSGNCICSDNSVIMGNYNSSDDSLLQDSPRKAAEIKPQQSEQAQPFHIGTFVASDPPSSSFSGTFDPRPTSFNGNKFDDSRSETSRDALIDLIRTSSQRSESGASSKPDPSPKHFDNFGTTRPPTPPRPKTSLFDAMQPDTSFFEPDEGNASSSKPEHAKVLEDTVPKAPSSGKVLPKKYQADMVNPDEKPPNFKNILLSHSSSSGPSTNPTTHTNLSGIPANAILASMLFRRAHSESTMALPGERGRPSDPFDEEVKDMPLCLELDLMEQQTVSSVTEDAGSFYHENFERWNNRAHRALNNLYSAAEAKFNMIPKKRTGVCGTVHEGSLFGA